MKFSLLIESLQASNLPLFYSDKRVFSGVDFISEIMVICEQIQQYKETSIGIYFDSTYDFCLSFFAILYAAKKPIILPSAKASFINEIAKDLDLILTDIEIKSNVKQLSLETLRTNKSNKKNKIKALSIANTVTFFTSGSTGFPKKIVKTLDQLESEIAVLETLWGSRDKNSLTISTVSHQHIYGFLFKVLWPIFHQYKIWTELCHYPEQWLNVSKNFAHIRLISSPSHLGRMHSLIDLSNVKTVKQLFSSGAPLKFEDSKIINQQLGLAVTEIYGSTETGGIAFREQYKNGCKNEQWTALPKVHIAVDKEKNCLKVKSPFACLENWYQTADRIKLISANTFLLQGRTDRIAKIEGKRVSLVAIENFLANNHLVNQAVAIEIEGKRHCIGCIIVLSTAGNLFFAENGKAALNKQLKSYLSNDLEAVVLPRKWRLLAELPTNQQGKLNYSALKSYFTKEQQKPKIPLIYHQEIKKNEIHFQLHIPPDLDYFDGHFASKPIVPGVVQIEWAGYFGEKYFPIEGDFFELEAIKFHDFICPNDKISLSIIYNKQKNKLIYTYQSDKGKHASGRILYKVEQ